MGESAPAVEDREFQEPRDAAQREIRSSRRSSLLLIGFESRGLTKKKVS
jgi:hypothetical protein